MDRDKFARHCSKRGTLTAALEQ